MDKQEYNDILNKTLVIDRQMREGKNRYNVTLNVLRLIIILANHLYKTNRRIDEMENVK